MKYLETGGAFCVAACFGFRSAKHLHAFSLSLQSECIKKAKPKIILPYVPADTHCPSGCEMAALNKAHNSSSTAGLDLSLGWSKQGASLPQSLLGGILVHLSWKPPGQAILGLSFQPFQPKPGLVNAMTLPYTFSNWVLLCLEAQCPKLDPVLTSLTCQDHFKLWSLSSNVLKYLSQLHVTTRYNYVFLSIFQWWKFWRKSTQTPGESWLRESSALTTSHQ